MDIKGTVTISLSDYAKLHRRAKRGTEQLVIHQELLDKTSACLSSIIYDESLTPEQVQRVVGNVKALSNSLPTVDFYSDSANRRVILKMKDDGQEE